MSIEDIIDNYKPIDHPWGKVYFNAIKHYLINVCDNPNDGMLIFMILDNYSENDTENLEESNKISNESFIELIEIGGDSKQIGFVKLFLNLYREIAPSEEQYIIDEILPYFKNVTDF
jgi:hypothetical protein